MLQPTASLLGNGVGSRLWGAVAAWLAVLMGVSVGAAVTPAVGRQAVSPSVSLMGPEPGHLTTVWDQPMFLPQLSNEGSVLDSGTATVVRWAGLQLWAVDAGTGRTRWTKLINVRPGDDLRLPVSRVIVSDGMVVAIGVSALDKPARLVVGFRATDGRQLWQARVNHPVTIEQRMLLVQPDDSSISVMDLVSGGVRWTSRLPPGCATAKTAGEEIVAIELACATGSFVVALDPRDGHKRWQLAVPMVEGAGTLQVADRLVLWGGGEDFQYRLVDPSGRVIMTRPAGSGLRFADLTAGGDVALVRTYSGNPNTQELIAVDIMTGRPRWRAGTRAVSHTLAAGRAYAVESLPSPLLPLALSVVDLSTGRTTLTATSFVGGAQSAQAVSVLGVGEGTLLLHYFSSAGGARVANVTAYRTIPVDPSAGYAAGAPAKDWPDACGLLTTADLARSVPGIRYTAYPRATTGVPVPFPHATTCDHQPSPITAPAVSVAVRWVGVDVLQARSLLADPTGWDDSTVVTIDGEDESIMTEFGSPPNHVEVILRVGRRIVSISVTGDIASAKALARSVAVHLHALPA